MSTAVAAKRVCACGCGVSLSRYNLDDYTWQCRERVVETFGEDGPPAPKPKKRPNVYNREILTRMLVEWSERHDGRTPLATEMSMPEIPSRTTYKLHFGSWGEAVKAAGLTPNMSAAMKNRPGTHRLRLLALLREQPTTAHQAAEALGRDPKRVFRLIHRLREDGELVIVGKVPQDPPLRSVLVNVYGVAK